MALSSGWLESSQVKEKFSALYGQGASADARGFAEASLSLISVFDLINGMGVASGDMRGNANTVLGLATTRPGSTLEQLIDTECDGKHAAQLDVISNDGKTATCALLWLGLALNFILKMLRELIDNPMKALSECVYAGYEVSLKPHHGMLIRSTFGVAVNAAPSRADFIAKLGPSEEAVFATLGEHLPALEELFDAIASHVASALDQRSSSRSEPTIVTTKEPTAAAAALTTPDAASAGAVSGVSETTQEAFAAASATAGSLPRSTSDRDKLRLYALFKQAKSGPAPATNPASPFDVVASEKYKAWLAVSGLTTAQAQQQYVELVAELQAPTQPDVSPGAAAPPPPPEAQAPSKASAFGSVPKAVAAAPATFKLAQRVECRDDGEELWKAGVVMALQPLKVRPDGDWEAGYVWDEVRPLEPGRLSPRAIVAVVFCFKLFQFVDRGVTSGSPVAFGAFIERTTGAVDDQVCSLRATSPSPVPLVHRTVAVQLLLW